MAMQHIPACSAFQELQVCAAKGKGGMRQGGMQQQQQQMPPTPEVDPENVEFVIFARNPKVTASCCLLSQCLHIPKINTC